MPISVECSSCHTRLSAPDAAAGKRVKCPKCKSPIVVPNPAAPPPPATPAFDVVEEPAAGNAFDFDSPAPASPPPPPPAVPPRKPATAQAEPPAAEAVPEAKSVPSAEPAGGAFDFDGGSEAASPAPVSAAPVGGAFDFDAAPEPSPAPVSAAQPAPTLAAHDTPPTTEDKPAEEPSPKAEKNAKPFWKKKPPLAVILVAVGVVLLSCCGTVGGVGYILVWPTIQEFREFQKAKALSAPR